MYFLLVEDDRTLGPLIQEELRIAFSAAWETTVIVDLRLNGNLAQQQLAKRIAQHQRIDGVITDIGLVAGAQNGLDLIRWIRSHPVVGRTPIVILSGHIARAQPLIAEGLIAAQACIPKGVDLTEMVERLVSLMMTPKNEG